MKLITRYIGIQIIVAILAILAILTALELFIAFVGELSDIGQAHYGLWQAFRYVLLDMPHQIYQLMPMAGLVGSLVGLGVLANQSELMVIRASGYSKTQITLTVLQAALVMMLIAIVLGEVIAPYAERAAQQGKQRAQHPNHTLITQHGVWVREQNRFIHIGEVHDPHHLRHIQIYHFNRHRQLQQVIAAKKAVFQQGKQWLLQQVSKTRLLHHHTRTQQLKRKIYPIAINPELLMVANTQAPNMTLVRLHQYIHYLQHNGLQAQRYQLNFWQRIFQPFAMLVMILLAVPFVFGSTRSLPVGVRVLTGIVLGFVFYILNEFFGPFSLLYQLPPLVGAALPTLIFTVIGAALLWRSP